MTKTCLEFYQRGGKSPIATVDNGVPPAVGMPGCIGGKFYVVVAVTWAVDGAARINPPPAIRYCVIVVPADNTGTPLA